MAVAHQPCGSTEPARDRSMRPVSPEQTGIEGVPRFRFQVVEQARPAGSDRIVRISPCTTKAAARLLGITSRPRKRARLIIFLACRRRSASSLSRIRSFACPRTTQASFQARAATSRSPARGLRRRTAGSRVQRRQRKAAALRRKTALRGLRSGTPPYARGGLVDVAPWREQRRTDSGRSILPAVHQGWAWTPSAGVRPAQPCAASAARIADGLAIVDRIRHVQCIDDEPGLWERATVKVRAEHAAHQRVGAIHADQKARAHLPLLSGAPPPTCPRLAALVTKFSSVRPSRTSTVGCCTSFERSTCSSSGWSNVTSAGVRR